MKEQKQKTVQDNGERNKEEEVEYQLKRRDLENGVILGTMLFKKR